MRRRIKKRDEKIDQQNENENDLLNHEQQKQLAIFFQFTLETSIISKFGGETFWQPNFWPWARRVE